MYRRNAVLALLQCMAMVACDIKSGEVPRSHRSIIRVPTFDDGHFARCPVVGYDGQCRPMFDESAEDTTTEEPKHCCSDCYSSVPATRSPAGSAELQYTMNDAWLAVIDNIKRNNVQSQRETENKEAWRQFQWNLSNSQ